MYVKNIAVSKLRCFDHAELTLNHPDAATSDDRLPNVNLLLGSNGAGKSTVLQALAIGVLSPVIQDSGYVPYYLVRRAKAKHSMAEKQAVIETDVILHSPDYDGPLPKNGHKIRTQIIARGTLERIHGAELGPTFAPIYNEESSAFFVVGYGATRRIENAEIGEIASRKLRTLRYQRVAGLFEDYVGLRRLIASKGTRGEEVMDLINSLLPEGTRFTGTYYDDKEPLFDYRGVELPLGALSDGYRAYIGWICDLIHHLREACPPRKALISLPGLVLVDEIDLHLHPSWQREVVLKLACAFPRLQFVLTSHSPIVAGTLRPENIFLMEAGQNGSSEVRQIDEPLYGLNADQVLTSSYFDLTTTRAPDAERNLQRLARDAENGHPEEAVKFLLELSRNRSTK